MAKKKNMTPEQKQEAQMQKLYKYYSEANVELSLEGLSLNEQIQKLVSRCVELMDEITKTNDNIKIDDLSKVQELTSIDKKTYLDFVNICALKSNDKLKDKAIDKFKEDFYQRLLITNLRHSFLESYMNGNDLKITDEDNEEYVPFTDYKSEEFLKIMEQSANRKDYLLNVLWKQYKGYAKAAEYLTKLELPYKEFKELVDFEYYKNGGIPTDKSPSKLWAIFNKFNHSYRLLSKYGYNDTILDLNDEFGLDVIEKTPHPKDHPWKLSEELNTID